MGWPGHMHMHVHTRSVRIYTYTYTGRDVCTSVRTAEVHVLTCLPVHVLHSYIYEHAHARTNVHMNSASASTYVHSRNYNAVIDEQTRTFTAAKTAATHCSIHHEEHANTLYTAASPIITTSNYGIIFLMHCSFALHHYEQSRINTLLCNDAAGGRLTHYCSAGLVS